MQNHEQKEEENADADSKQISERMFTGGLFCTSSSSELTLRALANLK